MIVARFAVDAEYLILAYFGLLNTVYFVFTLQALFDVLAYRRNLWRGDLRLALSESSYRPVSLLVPAFNEQETVIATIRSLLNLRYPEFEIVVVNDGSTDDTMERLRRAFALSSVPYATRSVVPTQRVRGVYRDLQHPNLVVVDKENGGKSDSLNAGINVASFPLFCSMDADSLLEADALLRITRAFVEDDRVLAAGGIIRVLNNSVVQDGRVVEHRSPNRPMVLVQALEYVRGFLAGRAPLARLNALLIISGAFGVFRKDAVVAAGGFHTGTVCEDMEIVVRLNRWAREQGNEGRIIFLPDPVCWTQVPSDWRSLLQQRDRWQRGLLESLWLHKKTFLNPRYGALGLIGMPWYLFFEALAPVIEVVGYVLLIALALMGRLSVGMALMFFVFAMMLGVILSLLALVLDALLIERYERARDFAKMFLAALLEFLGFRQILAARRTWSYVSQLWSRGEWGRVRRREIAHTEKRSDAA